MADNYDNNENVESTDYQDITNNLGVDSKKGIQGINTIEGFGSNKTQTSYAPVRSYASAQSEDEAKAKADLDYATGVQHVLDDKEITDYVSTKELYKKTLGVTEYDELRTKLHLKKDESFTDYYNRTHYVPEGFEMQAKLLLAEEKRKKLYAEMQSGKMSEEDFLYEAYGKDLLKQDGVDFSSSLYWYQRYKSGQYDDPRDNATYMSQVIESARTVFQSEKWFEELQKADLASMLEGLVTGEELPATTIQEIFSEQFDELTKYYDNAEQIVKYYRAGMLQGFNPTIDINGDGKIDYYLAPDGKLYNVNETGDGANTYRAYYNDDGSLSRIVASDSVVGEMTGEFFKSIGRFFTGVIDLGALAIGAVHDVFDGGKFGDTIAEYQANMGKFWNTTILKDTDYVVDSSWTTSDGSFNWAGIGRQVSSLAGTVAAFVITSGMSTAISASSKLTTVGGKIVGEVPKGLTGSTAKLLHKLGSSKVLTKGVGKAVKATAKYGVSTALQLTSWSNGAFGSGLGARVATSAMLATRDGLQSIATLAANQKVLGLSDSEVVTHALGGAAINFGASLALRQVADQGAMRAWAQFGKRMGGVADATAKGAIANQTAPTLFGRILTGTMTAKDTIGVGIANTAMDAVENIITAWTQTSLSRTGKVFDAESLKGLFMSPQFVANGIYQARMSFKDEIRISKNAIIGATTDAIKMDQEYRKYIAEAKAKTKPEEQGSLDALIVAYDKDIKDFESKTNPATGSKYTEAEARLAALENQIKNLDISADSDFIKNQTAKVKKYINETKIMYAQAVFNSANNTYKAYTDLSKDAWNLKADFLYGKHTNKLLDDYAEIMQKYVAVPIDTQLYYDVYNTDYMSYITKKIREEKNDANLTDENYIIKAGVDRIDTKEDGTHDIKYTIAEVSDEAKQAYNDKLIQRWGMEGRSEDLWIVLKNTGDSEGQKQILKDDPILRATVDVTNEVLGISDDMMPFIVELDKGVYVIPNFGKLGDNFQKDVNVSAVFNTLRLIRYNYENSKSVKDHFLNIVGIAINQDLAKMEIEEQKKYTKEIRAIINSLCGEGKALNDGDAVRLIEALKLEGLDVLAGLDKGDSNYSHLLELSELTKMHEAYEKAKTSYKEIEESFNSKNALSVSQQTENYNNISDFRNTYPFGNQLRQKGEKFLLLNSILLKNIDELPFVKDLQDGLNMTSLLTQLRTLANKPGDEITPEEKKVIFEMFLDRLGYTSEPISNTKMDKDIINAIESCLADHYLIRDEFTGDTKIPANLRKSEGTRLRKAILETVDKIKEINKSSQKNKLDLALEEIEALSDRIQGPEFDKIRKALKSDPDNVGATLEVDEFFDEVKFRLVDNLIKEYDENIESDKAIKVKELILSRLKSDDSITKVIPTAVEELTKEYKYTHKDYKKLKTMFDHDLELASKMHKNSINIQSKKILVVDLNRVIGDTGASILSKFKNDKLLDDFLNGDENSKYNQLFPNATKRIEFQKEMSKLKDLKRTYEDDVLYFHIDSAEQEQVAKGILENLYNYQYALRNADDIELPGVYLVSKDTEGIELKTSVSAIKNMADNYNNSKITDQRIELTQDLFAIFESLASGFEFINEESTIDPNAILLTNMNAVSDNNTRTYKSLVEYVNHVIDVKLGKLAGNKVKLIKTGFTGFGLADNDVDLDLTKKYFISRAIDIAESCFKNPSASAIIPNPKKKDIAKYEQFYEISNYGTGKKLLTPRKDIDFKKEAYATLTKDPRDIVYVFGINSKPQDPSNKTIGINTEGKVISSQITTGNTPYSEVFEKLLPEFSSTDIKELFIAIANDKNLKFKRSEIEYSDDILNFFKNKKVKDILAETGITKENAKIKNNIFYKMQLRSIEAALEVSNNYKSRLNSERLTDEVYNMLGNRNFRANLATAMNDKSVRDVMTFNNGRLEITDKLINAILAKYTPVTIQANKEDASRKLDVDTKGVSTILTGSQTATLNPDTNIKLDAESLKSFLELANIKTVGLTNITQTFNPLQTFYAMMLAATGDAETNKAFITLKDIHHLSEQDCKIILEELEGNIDSASYNKLRNAFFLIKTSEEYKKGSNDTLAETKSQSTIYSKKVGHKRAVSKNTSEGLIVKLGGDLKLKEVDIFQNKLKEAIRNNYGKEKLKISSIIDSANSRFARQFYDTFNTFKSPNVTNKGSLLVANMDISTNRAALFNTIASLAKVLMHKDIKNNFKTGKKELSLQEASQLAFDLYMYTTGDDYQPHYPQYILYDKKNRKIVSTALSSKNYTKEYDDLITELFLNTRVNDNGRYLNKTDSTKPNSNDIVIISLPRNSLSSIYTPDVSPDISLLHLNETDEVGNSVVRALIDYSYTNFVNSYKARHKKELPDDIQLQEEWVKSLFNKRLSTAKYEDEQLKKLSKRFTLDEEIAEDIFNAISSYSFTEDGDSLGEARAKAFLGSNSSNILNKKENDAVTFGITEEGFNKRIGFKNIIADQRQKNARETKKILNLKDLTPLDDLVDAINSQDKFTIELAVNNLPDITKSNLETVIKYVIANLDSLESKMFMLSDRSLSDYKDINIRDDYEIEVGYLQPNNKNRTFKKVSDIRKGNHLTSDAESIYTDDGNNTFPYQIGFEYKTSNKELSTKTLYLPIGGAGSDIDKQITEGIEVGEIKSGEDLAKFIRNKLGCYDWYKKYYEANKGTQLSIDKLFDRYTSKDPNKALYYGGEDALGFKVDPANTYFVGFNNNEYDNELILNYVNDTTIQGLIKLHSLDLRVIKDQIPTTIQFRNMKGEGTLPGTIDTALKEALKAKDITLKEHDADSDVRGTSLLLDEILDKVIPTNHYQNKIVDTINTLKTALNYDQDIDFKFEINKDFLNTKELKDYENLINLNKPSEAIKRLRNIVDYYNFRNTMSAVHTSDILTKDIRQQIFKDLNKGQIRFANTFKNTSLKAEARELISIAINKEWQQGKIDLNYAKSLVMNRIAEEDYSSENTILYKISDIKNLKSLLNLSDEDIATYKQLPQELNKKYSIDTDETLSSDKTGILAHRLTMSKQSIINAVNLSTKNIEDAVIDLLKSIAPNDNAHNYILKSLNNFFDVDEEAIKANGGILPQANARLLIDAISKIDKDVWDKILSDPFLTKGYKEIYRMVTAPPLNKKLKTIDGRESILKNDTLAITQKQLAHLLEVNNLTEQTLKQSLGLSDKDTLYIPVIRHPLDKTDSVHFLKVMIIEEGQGIDVAINADTMKTRFNGDLDGDHIMILKPSKAMEQFANTHNEAGETLASLQHNSLGILYDLLEKHDNGKFFNNIAEHNVTHLHQALAMTDSKKNINNKYVNNSQILRLLNTYKQQVFTNYDQAKQDFKKEVIDLIKNSKKLYDDYNLKFNSTDKKDITYRDKFIDDLVDEIFWVKPVDMSAFNNVENNTRLVTFSDYLGLQDDSDNLEARRRYRFGEISTYGTLRLGDSESGTLQKALYGKERITYKDLQFVENLIRLSGTTKSALESLSEDSQKVLLKELLASSGSLKKGKHLTSYLKNIKKFSDKVEQLLIAIQITNMNKRQALAGKAIEDLKVATDKDADTKFLKYYLGEDSDLNNSVESVDFILNMKKQLKNSFGSSAVDIDESINTMFNLYSGRIPNKENNDKSESLFTTMPVVYVKDASKVGFTDIVTEDTLTPLPGINNYEVNKPKIFKLNIDSVEHFNKFKGKDITLKQKELKMLNLSKDLEGLVRVVEVDKDNNILLVSLATPLNGQKVVFASTDASKATVSTYATITNRQALNIFNDNGAAFIKLFGQDAAKKAMEVPSQTNIKYFDASHEEIINANGIQDDRVAYYIVDEKVNIAEAPRLYDQKVKETYLEELAHANNIDSINGAFLYNGNLYQVDEEGRVTFDNKPLFDIKQKIDRANMPDRIEANGYNLYLLLKAIVVANQNKISKDQFRMLYGGGPAAWKNYTDNVQASTSGKSFESVILSKELEDFIMQDTLKRTNAHISDDTNIRSENSAYTDLANAGNSVRNEFATGDLTDMNNGKRNFQANHYIPKHELINKINELMGNEFRLYRNKLQQGERYGLFSNGVYQRRTQTSNGPREAYDKELGVQSNNTTNLKTGSVYTAENVVSENPSLFPGDILSSDFSPEDEFTGFDSRYFYEKPRGDTKPNKYNRFNSALELLKSQDFKSDTDYAVAFSGKYESLASIKTDYRGFNDKGELHYSIKPTKINDSTSPQKISTNRLLNIVRDLGISSTYYSQLAKFKEDFALSPNHSRLNNTDPSYYSRVQNLNALNDSLKNAVSIHEDASERFIKVSRDKLKELSTIEDVVKEADKKFYSGESKVFTAEKIKMNQGIKLDSTEAIEADRVIKGMSVEANSISMSYNRQLVILNNIATRNNSIDEVNKFAYILAASNKIQVIDHELKAVKDEAKKNLLNDTKKNTLETLRNLGVEDHVKFIEDFTKTHTEEANMVYTLLQQLNTEASKYSKLCGEPGQNIFFLLTPSVKKGKKENTTKFNYIVSMLAKGNNPIQYDKEKLGWVSTSMPIYDGYNFFSSMATSITAISKQAAIYNNSLRLKKLGLMTNASIATNIIELLSSKEVIEKLDSSKDNEDHKQTFKIYAQGLKDVFRYDPEAQALIGRLQKAEHLSTPEKYIEAMMFLDGYINKMGLTLEEASSAEILNNMPELDKDTYSTIVAAHNIYADTFAALSSFCDDELIDIAYAKLTSSLNENQVLVDKFGRRLDDMKNMYAQSEASLEVWLELLDGYMSDSTKKDRNMKRRVINKLLTGEVFIMDKTLAETLADRVFVKKELKGMQDKLRKVSSFCVAALMSNPLKIVDRLVKFTMFDAAALSTADHKTLTKTPTAFKDLRAYFASKGVATTKNLDEFLYSQGININTSNFDSIYNGNNPSLGFNPLKTYTDAVGNVFNYQTLATRYAYWLAAKESLEKGDYSVLGSAYYMKDKIRGMQATDKVSKAGQQASFAMAQNLGSPGDFPGLSRDLSNYGMVFTTFPLAAVRWGIGEARSLKTITSEIMRGQFNGESARWLMRNSGGILGTFIAEQLLISVIADMFGIQSIFDDDDEEDETDDRRKEWKDTGALPNITQTILTGEPIMDTYSSMNITRELKGMTIDPFLKNEDNSAGGLSRFFYKNVLSHINPVVKNVVEVTSGKDLIDDKVIDTKDKYTMFENIARKFSSYFIGAAGANAMINSFASHDSMGENFTNGLTAAVSAECGNTKTYKSNLKNYYKSLNKINSYLYSGTSSKYLQDSNIKSVKTELQKLINSQPQVTDVYALIKELTNKGYDASEIRSAFRSCSLQYKLEQVQDIEDLRDSLSDASFNNIKTAIAFENYMYPWLDDGINYLDRYIQSNYNKYTPNLNYGGYNNYSNYYNSRPSYNTYKPNYNNYNQDYNSDPFSVYSQMQKDIAYDQRQAEYQRRQKQYKENS